MPDTKATASSRGHHLARWVVAAGVVVVVVGAIAWWDQSDEDRAAAVSAGRSGQVSTAPVAPSPEAVRARWEPGAPRHVQIPALDVSVPVVPVKAPGRTLVPPSDPQQLGWWADGAEPGARRGSALITGHTVHTGGGALDDLEQLEPGDAVVVRTQRGTIRYDVRRVHIYSKGSLAAHAEKVFSQHVAGRLVLITCEDWDGERYLSNVVVVAVPRT
ncbi:class F sortase [Nocardioides sp. CN2-186]|uniref:class F sortase n=1 Tax=Nocardioides tweenelious TaxID=3156607 RepID=UPI0032B61823